MPPMIVARHSPAIVNFDSADRYGRSRELVGSEFPQSRFLLLMNGTKGLASSDPDLFPCTIQPVQATQP